jgi:hypothetical protein
MPARATGAKSNESPQYMSWPENGDASSIPASRFELEPVGLSYCKTIGPQLPYFGWYKLVVQEVFSC